MLKEVPEQAGHGFRQTVVLGVCILYYFDPGHDPCRLPSSRATHASFLFQALLVALLKGQRARPGQRAEAVARVAGPVYSDGSS